MTRIAIAGAAGRMGTQIIALAQANADFEVAAALEQPGHAAVGRSVPAGGKGGMLEVTDSVNGEFDVLIDFTLPEGTMHWLKQCRDQSSPIVIGTTGHDPRQLEQIAEAARSIPVLKASNMSVGINLMFKLAADVARALGEDYDIEIVETHHRFKRDAPSGTANTLRDVIADATGRDAAKDVVYGRQGNLDQRPPGQIGMHALRVGDTVGEHEVYFGNLGETFILKHSAHTRDTFASGALRAAAWIVGKAPGLYDMHHVLGLH